MEEEQWYVIQVASGAEQKVVSSWKEILDREFLKRYCIPVGEFMQKKCGKWIQVKRSLFPGYVFVQVKQVEDFYFELKKVPYFTKLLGDSSGIIALYKEEIKFLQKIIKEMDHKNGKIKVSMSEGYLEGDKVIITNGPLVGMEGQIKKIDRHKRIAILKMELFGGRVTEVKMGLEVVNRLHDSKRQK